ncbi:hypothetical protein FB45DRAFT_1029897 [Roridomyces roridus]|uniref:MOSC domain-containing protein n=1 Tax=Roridomyces roridus TaxID=1738132 RepID=A0AAD7BMD7_9AGAR|nr:hypothetical protein FB45DRAFT_1029897 [Roridomyces roridus]
MSLVSSFVRLPVRPVVLLFAIIGTAASLFIVARKRNSSERYLRDEKPDTVHGKDIRVARIMVYPIKSCAGIDLNTSAYDKEGFEFDRKWMVVDVEKNKQLSARDNRGIKLVRVFPAIKRDSTSPDGGVLHVSFPDSETTPSFSVPLIPSPDTLSGWDKYGGFDLWGHAEEGYIVDHADDFSESTPALSPSEILSEYIGRRVLLVMNTPAPRPLSDFVPLDTTKVNYEGGSTVRYSDFSPFLLCSTKSIEDAEERVWAMARGESVGEGCTPLDGSVDVDSEWARKDGAKRLLVDRFRPNVVMSGVEDPFGEDDWQEIAIGPNHLGSNFLLPLRCARCMFPNVDPLDGNRDLKMPNNAMMQYRRVEAILSSKYCFGMHMVPADAAGVLNVGDSVVVKRSMVNPKLVI